MKKKVLIPSLKPTDHSIGCVYPNVFAMSCDRNKANEEILKAACGIYDDRVAFGAECIAEDNFLGNRLGWLEKHAVMKWGREMYLLSNTDGGVFLTMIKDGNIGTDDSLRRKAIEYVEEMADEDLNDMVVRAHDMSTHQWVECEPDGTVHGTEEVDNNTTHWIDYPNEIVACIYEICSASGGACNCDTCTMYKHFNDMDKDEFVERYSEEDWNYCNEHSLDDAILDFERENDGLTGEDIRKQMIDAIEDIEHGYFEDE